MKVVLLANGIGSNPQTYRPHADESQWWNRRDALVRCVTAFFFCSTKSDIRKESASSNGDCHDKELIILFDGDWSYFSIKFIPCTSSTNIDRNQNKHIPSESNIIQLWKCSTQNPGIRIRCNNLALSCLCVSSTSATITTEPHTMKDMESVIWSTNDNNINLKHKSFNTGTTTPLDSTNKRSILEYLQSTCSMEFLRLHKYDLTLVCFQTLYIATST